MAVPTQPPLLRETHRNSYLFSNYYLNERLTHRDDWALDEAETRAAFEALRQQWRDFSANGTHAKLNESQTEQRWVRPVLEALGHRYAVQVALATPRQTRFPDYLLFIDDAARARAEYQSNQAPLTEADLASALAVADAKRWDRPLDKATKVQGDDVDTQISATPSVQIDFYIRHSGLDWGVLTNGHEWRLYHKATSKKLDVFYAVDLPALLEQGDLDAFKYFYRFFRQAAFLPDANGNCWLDRIRERSDTYERGVSDGLKRQVYNALTDLAQGFLDFPANGLHPTLATRKEIYDNSLIVLYRLLFILYAEARNLLPVDASAGGNVVYRDEYSFQHIKEEVVAQIKLGKTGVATRSSVWNGLVELWETIDRGDPNLDVPAYNGGLFKPQNHPFLQRYRVGDSHLISAIDKLARVEDPETGLRVFVDYRDLEIRHLGSIYEGLLEYNLAVDANGCVDLLTDKGERKATGSYYTPDYIVQYIVEQTVGPVLDEILEAVTGSAGDKVGADVDFDAGVELARRALQINVLDPAMGSGHFLVAATDYIARWLVEWGATPTPSQPSPQREMFAPHPRPLSHPGRGESLAPFSQDGRRAGDEGAFGLPQKVSSRQPHDGEGVSSALAYWRRRVAQACIYGVDLNPLAVELAKLALWLTTVAQDKPLSFLDHHLRCGNSLIGARLDELTLGVPQQKSSQKTKEKKARAAGQMTMLDDSAFVGSLRTATRWMGDIEGLSGETLAEVREAEQIYQQTVRDATATLRTIADVWTAQHFGLSEDITYLQNLSRHLLHPGGISLPRYETTVQQARDLASQHRFFHWELEFPEVFFDEEGQPLGEDAGFDAVVGNPPYIRSVQLRTSDSESWNYYANTYRAAAKREYDIYLCFVELGRNLIMRTGLSGMITPNKWFTTRVGESLREMLSEEDALAHVVDFGAFQVFDQVTTYTCLLFLTGQPRSEFSAAVLQQAGNNEKPLPQKAGEWLQGMREANALSKEAWSFSFGASAQILDKLDQLPKFEEVAQIFKGTGTSADHVFFMERKGDKFFSRSLDKWVEIEADVLRPALTGRNIGSHFYETGNFLLFPYDVYGEESKLISPSKFSENYPLAWRYLNQMQNREILEGRDRGAFRDRADWYGFGRPQNLHLLGQPKIVLPDVADHAKFAYDAKGQYIIDTAYGVRLHKQTMSLPALAAILNTPVMTFFLQETGTDLRGGYFRMKTAYLNPFPIPRIDFTTPADERERRGQQGQQRYADFRQSADDAPLLGFVTGELAAGRSDVVHDLLAFLAEQMIALHEERQRLQRADDPFKWLDRGAAVNKLERVLRNEITYGERVDEPLLEQPHDLDGLRLAQSPSGWTLEAQLKLRDPEDPKQWQKEANGRDIVRRWVAVYRFADDMISEAKARFYRYALEARSDFAQAKGFPGGATRSAAQKLRLTTLPIFDDSVDLTPLDGLRAELVAVRGQIAQTDRLIDRIVYELYGLTEEEIALVEGS